MRAEKTNDADNNQWVIFGDDGQAVAAAHMPQRVTDAAGALTLYAEIAHEIDHEADAPALTAATGRLPSVIVARQAAAEAAYDADWSAAEADNAAFNVARQAAEDAAVAARAEVPAHPEPAASAPDVDRALLEGLVEAAVRKRLGEPPGPTLDNDGATLDAAPTT